MKPVETPWARGRFDRSRRGSQILFGRMYEDVAIELEVFRPQSRVFCIGSGGCTAFALAAAGHQVCAVDINEAQISYMRGRVEGRPYEPGAAERLISRGRGLIWSKKRMAAFMELESTDEQVEYWLRHLNTKRFQWSIRALLSAAALGLAYSAPMVAAIPPRMDLELRARMERCWGKFPNRRNPYARGLFLSEPPPKPEFDARLLEMHHAEAAAFLEDAAPARFDAFTLSNILDAAPGSLHVRLFAAVKRAAAPGAMVVLRSFRKRLLPGVNRAEDDRSILWGTVQVMLAEEV